MALRWFDGFESGTVNRYPTAGSVVTSMFRNGANCWFIRGMGALVKILETQTTWIVGFAIRITPGNATSANVQCAELRDGTLPVLSLFYNAVSSMITVQRGTTVLASYSDNNIKGNVWNYLEWKVLIADTGGSVEVRLNGTPIITVTGVDTKNSTTGVGADRVHVGQMFNDTYLADIFIDDFYICDGTGSTNNNFLGDIKVLALKPNGPGDITQMVPVGAATNWDCVDEVPSDTTTYVTGDVAGVYDLYNLTDLAAAEVPQTIYGIQIHAMATKDDTVTRQIATVLKSGGLEFLGPNLTLTQTTFTTATGLFTVDPSDGLAWTKAKLTALQAGVKVTA